MSNTTRRLTRGQTSVLVASILPMAVSGALGAWGTYTNIADVFDRSATALGVVAAGEGATFVLALVLVGLTMLGQSAPAPVRVGLWALPAVASFTGLVVARTATEAVVFAVTPMAMTVSAEGIGLVARRIVVYRTGVDAEAQRRNADTVRALAYHRARAVNHPSDWARKHSKKAAWRLARRVGVGDQQLGDQLTGIQREKLSEGADLALVDMLGLPVAGESAPVPAVLPAEEPRKVVTAPVASTPGELRKQARKLHRKLVAETGRGVTVDRLRTEFGLSRREAAEVRRQVVA